MSLPIFIKPKQTGLIVEQRKPDGNKEVSQEDQGLEACAQDAINAIHAKDAKALASALRAAFELMELEPHEEGPHTYDAQNRKAALERKD